MASSTNRTKTPDHQNKKTTEHAHESKDQSSTHSPHSRNKRTIFTSHSSSIRSNLFGSSSTGNRSSAESTSRLYARPFEEVLLASADTHSTTTNKPTDGSGTPTETKR